MSRPRRCIKLTLSEAVEAVLANTDSDNGSDSEDREIVGDICILPPSDDSASETEDIDEENLAADVPGEICGKLEIFSRTDDVTSTDKGVVNDEEESDVDQHGTSKKPVKKRRR